VNARLNSRLLSGLHLRHYSIPEPLQVVCVTLISTGRDVFIGVQGGVTDLIKLVTCQVVAGRPSHMADRPWSSAFTDLQLGIPLYHLLESVITKPTREWLQGGAGWPGGLAGWPPPGPTSQWSFHTVSSCQVHPWGDTNFDGIPNFLEMLQFGTYVPEIK
jgi:hypothetical protein